MRRARPDLLGALEGYCRRGRHVPGELTAAWIEAAETAGRPPLTVQAKALFATGDIVYGNDQLLHRRASIFDLT